jgi:hypothetical protein
VQGAVAKVTRMVSVPGAHAIAVAYANGDVAMLDTSSWRQDPILHVAHTIRDIAIAANGRTVAVIDSDDTVHIGVRNGDAATDLSIPWTAFPLRAQRVALTPDGLMVAICSDGTVWLYSPERKSWICLPTGTADLTIVTTSSEGRAAASFDSDGRITWLDLELAQKSFTDSM